MNRRRFLGVLAVLSAGAVLCPLPVAGRAYSDLMPRRWYPVMTERPFATGGPVAEHGLYPIGLPQAHLLLKEYGHEVIWWRPPGLVSLGAYSLTPPPNSEDGSLAPVCSPVLWSV